MPKPENKPIIAVDIDEVLFPMVPDLIEYVDREHKVKLTPEDFAHYSLEGIWPAGSAEGAIVFENYKDQVTTEIVPVKDAAEILGKLSLKYEVIVMTSRDIKVEQITKGWLNRHFPEVFKDVHLVGNQHDSLPSQWRPKSEVCIELGVSYLIDDNLTAVTQTSAFGIKALLFGDYPWNQAKELPEGVTRVKNWQEVLEYFDGQ
jgi:uncharacterized HAD superfamily protein